MDELIKLININKEFKSGENKIMAVSNLSLNIKKGESIAITGNSGSGKTTLLNIMGLIISQTSGKLIINSLDTEKLKENEKAEVRNKFFGYIVQEYALINGDSVAENVRIPLYYNKDSKKIDYKKNVMEILERVGIEKKAKEKIEKLSGGQKQRVAIARALINNPQVILADEPTGALDTKSSEEIFKLLMELVKAEKTLILVTHNKDLAKKCDREISMVDGRII